MGFKRKLVNAVDMYDAILEVMTSNGWQNISTMRTPAAGSVVVADGAGSDWDVLKSISNGAVYQMRPFRSQAETAVNHTIAVADDIRNTARKSMSIRMVKDYIPGIPNVTPAVYGPDPDYAGDPEDAPQIVIEPEIVTPVRGEFTSSPPWLSVNLFGTDNANPHTQDLAITVTNIEMMYNVTSEWAMFMFRFPPILSRRCTYFMIGIPPSTRGEKNGGHESILAQTFMTGLLNNRILSIDWPIGVGNVTANTYLTNHSQLQLPLRNPSYLREYWLAPVYYGEPQIGMRGKLDGIFALAANIGLVDRDQIIVGTKSYEVCELAVTSTNPSFAAGWMAIELDDSARS